MASKLKHIRSSVPGRVPTDSQIEPGQIAINTYDGKIFTKKDNGEIVALQAVDPDFASSSIFQGDTSLTILDSQDSTKASITASVDGIPKVVIEADGTEFNGPITVNAAETLFFNDADNNKYVGVQAPDDVNFSYIIKLPPEDSIDPAVLATDGEGNTFWGRPDAFGGNRVYVSDKYGDDVNDGVSQPVKSITRATQIAADLSYRPKVDPGREFYNAKKLLRDNKPYIKEEAIAFIEANFVNFYPTFDATAFGNDIEKLADAVIDDVVFDTNYRSSVVALELSETFDKFSTPGQQARYLDALTYALTRVELVVAVDANTIALVKDLWESALEIIRRRTPDPTIMSEIYFTANPSTISTAINAISLLQRNKNFIAEEQIAWIEGEITAGNSPFQDGLSYNQTDWKDHFRDVVDALCYDIYYSGNVATIGAADFLTYGVDNILSAELQFREAITHLQTYIDEVIESVTIVSPFQSTVAQTTDAASGSPTESTTAVTLLTEFNERTFQDNINYPVTITSPAYVSGSNQTAAADRLTLRADYAAIKQNTIVYIDEQYPGAYSEAKCRRDTGLIIDGLFYDIQLGTNYNQITSGLAYTRGTSAYLGNYQNIQTVESLKHAKSLASVLTSTSALAQFRNDEGWDEILYILENQVTEDGSTRPMQYPSPVGVQAELVEAKDILQDKRILIQNRAIDWITLNHPTLDYDSEKCRRDVGYVIDALCYDIMYGGNSATVYNAEMYYENAVAQLNATQRTITGLLYAQLQNWVEGAIAGTDFQEAIDQEGNPINVDPTTTATTGETTGTGTGTGTTAPTGGTPTAAPPTGGTTGTTAPTGEPLEPPSPAMELVIDDIQAKIGIIIDVVEQGLSVAPNKLYPDTAWVEAGVVTAATALSNGTSDIQQSVVEYIENNFTGFAYNQDKCARDTGLILDSAGLDAVLGTNYNAVLSGISYDRASSSVVKVKQLRETLLAITKTKDLALAVTNVADFPAALTSVTSSFDDILDIIENGPGVAPDLTFTTPTGADVNLERAKDQLQVNAGFIQAEILAWVSNNYPNLRYLDRKLSRDVGYLVDALSYDILYGGNSATRYNAGTYFYGGEFQGTLDASATAAAYNRLQTIVGQIVQGIAVSKSSGNTASQDSASFQGADGPTAAAVQNLVQIVEDVITQGDLTGLPTEVEPDVTWAVQDLQDAQAGIESARQDIIDATIFYIGTITFDYDRSICKRDVGLIVDAVAYDIVLGGNKKSVEGGLSYLTIAKVMQQQLFPTLKAIQFTRDLCVDGILNNEQYVPNYTNVAPFQKFYNNLSTITAQATVRERFDELLLVLTRPAKVEPEVVGISTKIATYNALQDAKEVIQTATTRFIKGTFSGFIYNVTTCERDIGLIVDAVCYDLITGSSFASAVAGRSYLRGTANVVQDSQKEETIAAFGYAKSLSLDYTEAVEQAEVAELWDIVIDIISTGTTDKGNIWLGFEYDSAKCERDVEYIVDAVRYDAIFNSNYRTVAAAKRYLSGTATYFDGNQKPQTIAAYGEAKTLTAAALSDATLITRSDALWDEVIDILQNGESAVDAFSYPAPTGGTGNASDSGYLNAAAQLTANKVFMQNEIVAWIAGQVGASQPPFTSSFAYDDDACRRDVGLIIDALIYDITYGGNLQTYDAARAYYDNAVAQFGDGEKEETVAALGRLETIVEQVIIETAVVISSGNTSSQDLTGTAGSSAAGSQAAALVQQIATTITNDGTLPVVSTPDISWTSGTFQSEFAALGSASTSTIAPGVTTFITNNVTNAFPDNAYTPLDSSASVADFQANKDTYIAAVTSYIATNYPTLTYDVAVCERDTGFLIDAVCHDLMYNGNVQTYIAADAYYSFGVLQLGSVNELAPTLDAYRYLQNLMISDATGTDTEVRINSLFADALVIIEEGDIPDIVEPRFDIVPITVSVAAGDFYIDNPIIVPDFVTIIGDSIRSVVIRPNNAGKDMFRTRNGTYIFGLTFKDALDENNIPTYTFNWAVAFDDPADTSIDRTEYFGIGNTKPVITTSPYIQNASIISFLGANGALVDGSKIQTPNIPTILEEVETPVNFGDGIPEQGKSFVSNAFTTLSFGGTGWLVINDAYAQIVSCFQIFMLNGSYCQSGGYLSITNSASNFGLYALRASGYSQNAFLFDRGYIVASGFDGGNTFTVIGTGREPIEQFVLRIRDINDNTDITNNFKQATTEVTFDAGISIDPVTNIITIEDHGFSNNQAVYYNSNGNLDIPGLLDQGQYFINIIDVDSFRLFNDNSLQFATDLELGAVGTHSFTLNAEEFIIDGILEEHNNYQTIILADGQGLNVNSFQVGQELIGDTSGFENTAFVYDWDHLTRTLVVSNEGTNVGAEDPITVRFEETSTITQVAGALIAPAYTIEAGGVTNITDYWTSTFTIDSTVPDNVIQNPSQAVGQKISFHRPSIVNSSSHTWEYSGSGIDYNALPQNGGKSQGTDFEQYSELPGRVYASGTNELGDFKVGSFIVAENKSGEIAFNARVTVGELAVLRLSLSDVNIEEFSTDVGLGDNETGGAKDERVSTQLAIRSFIANRLGNVLDKNVSANAVPGAVVQLNSAGQINADLLPPARGITTYNVNEWEGRLRLSDRVPPIQVIAGDNASETYQQAIIVVSNNITANKGDEITQVGNPGAFAYNQNTIIGNTVITLADVVGTFNTSGEIEVNGVAQTGVIPSTVNATEEIVDNYFMKSDTISQYLVLEGDVTYDFASITEVIGANSGAQGDITSGPTYGNIASLNYATFNAGSGYTPGTGTATYKDVPLTGGTGTGAVADVIVTAGVVESAQLTSSGTGYTAGDTLSCAASNIGGTGSGFSINVSTVQTRLFINLSGGFTKFSANEGSPEYIQDGNATTKTIADLTATTNITFNGADIGAGGNVDYLNSEFEVPAHGLVSGEAVKYSRNGNPVVGNLVDGQTYWVKVISSGVFELYANYAFTAGSQVLLGGSTSGTHVFAHDVVAIDVDTLNVPAHTFQTGDIVRLQGSDLPDGLLDETTYFVGSVTTNTFTLHEQGGDALASTNGVTLNPVDLADVGTGSATFTLQNVAIIGTVNTSSSVETNWGILASSSFDASAIVSGVIDPSRLAPEGSATDQSFLRLLNGNSAWVLAVQNARAKAGSPISITGDFFTDPADSLNKYYAELEFDVAKADDSGGDTNYTNLGVVGTNKLQFTTSNGQISIKSGVVDAGFLGGQAGNYYTNPNNLSASVPTNKGGTGLASFTAGDMIYSGATDSLTNLAIGPNNSVLFSDGSVPQWTTSPTFGGALTIGGIAAINSTSPATSETTGALRVAGGFGLGGDMYHTGTINTEQLNVINTDPSNNVAMRIRSSLQFQAVDGIQQITARMDQVAGGLRFDGAAGQLLTITDTLVGTVFSVNNDTKTLLEGNDRSELIAVPQSNSYLLVGQTTNDGVSRLQVTGNSVFTGNVNINGTLTASAKSFLIKHPTKAGHKLQYGSLESPYHGVRLTGEATVVNGVATIELPDYVHALCREEGVNVQLTNIRHGQVLWVETVDIANNQVEVRTENTAGEYGFYWSFTAIRKDIPPLATEYKY